jgi:hypothetical protein
MSVEAVPADPVLWLIRRRNGTELIVDAAELARLDGLKRRAYLTAKLCKIHECEACGKRDAWREGWGWYGSLNEIDNWDGEEPAVPKWCSEPCRLKLVEARRCPRKARPQKGW